MATHLAPSQTTTLWVQEWVGRTGWTRRNREEVVGGQQWSRHRPWQFEFFRNLHRKIATTRRDGLPFRSENFSTKAVVVVGVRKAHGQEESKDKWPGGGGEEGELFLYSTWKPFQYKRSSIILICEFRVCRRTRTPTRRVVSRRGGTKQPRTWRSMSFLAPHDSRTDARAHSIGRLNRSGRPRGRWVFSTLNGLGSSRSNCI